MTNYDVVSGIITAYRSVINDRYQYENIISRYDIPDSITRERFDYLREFFLEYIYPSLERRKDINDAFESLDNHIRHPDQLLKILIDSGGLILKFGWHLPGILKAGIKALKSFRMASRLEEQLAARALELGIAPPFSKEQVKGLMTALSRNDLGSFMDNGMSLFETLYDRVLVTRILEVVGYIINVMKKRPEVYDASEIRGLELGREVIEEGNKIFDQLSEQEQALLFDTVYQIEKDAIGEIFSAKEQD